MTDYINWLWESDGPELELDIRGADGTARTVQLQRGDADGAWGDDSWGIVFSDVIYDEVHTCDNSCVFCFMQQLPRDARSSLTVRDDDYRLSFLQGNFITLTNTRAVDKQRIIDQRISPLRVSFHAADPAVRETLIGSKQAAALENLDELIDAGIDFHIQIVLLPGVNDGDVLEETLQYLKDPKRLPHILSVGIVPVAFTDHSSSCLKNLLNSASVAGAEREEWSKAVIEQVQRHQFAEHEQRGLTWVYLADEFYIHAHAPFPLPEFYDGFPQLENGIGMVLNFIADVREHYAELCAAVESLPVLTEYATGEAVTIICGELLTHTWLGILSSVHAGGKVRLLPVRNRYFGGNVSVTGLLTARDIQSAIEFDFKHMRDESPEATDNHQYLIPDCIFNDDGLTLDDCSADTLVAGTKARIRFYRTGVSGLIEALNSYVKEYGTDA